MSDIHSNLEALTAVLSDIDEQSVDEIVCLGDIVGYNADPNESITLIRERNIKTVIGNHDSRAAGLQEPANFNAKAREAILWTRNKLSFENKNFLRTLPLTLDIGDDFLIIHGSLDSYDEYIYTEETAAWNFGLMNKRGGSKLCFFGHTHMPGVYAVNGDIVVGVRGEGKEYDLNLRALSMYLINPGSVGQPRDGDTRAAYIIYDTDKATVSFKRVSYDLNEAVEKVSKAGLPASLARRLKEGW